MITFKQFILESEIKLPKKLISWSEGLPLFVQEGNKIPPNGGYILYAYHGTKGSFDKFDTTRQAYNGIGSFFTPERNRAVGYMHSSYSSNAFKSKSGSKILYPAGSKLYKAFLKIKTPYVIESLDNIAAVGLKLYKNDIEKYKKYAIMQATNNNHPYPDRGWEGIAPSVVGTYLLRELGHNCFIHQNNDGIQEVCMFNSEDIYKIG